MKKDSEKNQLTPLENALQTQFKPSVNSVREAFKIVEDSRSAFATNAVRFGLCALAAKPIVGHGNFGKWLSDSLSENGNPRPSAERTARDYIGLAKVFVQKLRHPKLNPDDIVKYGTMRNRLKDHANFKFWAKRLPSVGFVASLEIPYTNISGK